MSAEKLNLVQKLVKVYEEIDHVAKRGQNTSQGYRYMKAADLAHAVRNALQKLNVYAQVTFSDVRAWSFTTSKGSNQNAFDVTCNITFFDADDPASVVYHATGIGSGADFGDKGIFKAQTGALKYALRNAFLVPDDMDPENDENDKPDKKSVPENKTSASSEAKKTTETAGPAPQKAVIPESVKINKSGAEQTVPSPTTPTPSDRNISQSDDNEVPNEEELKPFRKQHIALVKLLSENGLTSETGKPQKKKVIQYLLSTAGVNTVESVTKGQWRAFFQLTHAAAESNIKNLIELVEKASK